MLTLFHVAELPTQIGARYTLDGDDGHHAARVLRISVGEELMLSDGRGTWSKTRVVAVDKKTVELEVLVSGFQKVPAISMTVIQAVTKGDKSKEVIELLTEAGADRIVLWQAMRSIGKSEKGVEKLRVVAHEASKQSRRFWIPEVSDVVDTDGAVEIIQGADLAIVFHEEAMTKLSDLLAKVEQPSSIVIVIGPEGGITDDELMAMQSAGAKVALLGRPILRSAHAGIAAISAVSAGLRIW
ncbi:MAG TPA: 16S rRNA (uracil(1498)-N(3))-methyltransferase [Candidatus Nanopelagicaceae bacterium]